MRKQIDVKVMTRTMRANGVDENSHPQGVSFHIREEYLKNGYELFETHFLGTEPDGAVRMMWVFVLYEDEEAKKSK